MAAGSEAGSAVFSRPASGLVRVASGWDVFIYNVGLVSVGIAIALNQYFGPSLYPGVSIELATVFAILGMLFAAATMYFWTSTFPRSGGVYVSLSRTVSPGTAFVLTVVEALVLLYYVAFAASLIVAVGLSSFFATVGVVSGAEGLFGIADFLIQPGGIFGVGTVILLIAGGLLIAGTRKFFTSQRIVFAIAIIGTFILGVVLAFGSRQAFQTNLSDLTGLDYQQVIQTALAEGFESVGFSMEMSVLFLVWPLLPLLGAVLSIGIGGEIKRVSRSQFFGMLGAVVFAGLLIAVFATLSNRAFGYEFQGAIAWNSLHGLFDASTEGAIGAEPWFTVLAGILTRNVVLSVIIMATFVAWIWLWIPGMLAYSTRTMIAWSFDRLAPDKLGHVSERLHTPVVAISLSTLVAIGLLWVIAFRGIEALAMIMMILITWGVAMLAAIVFPWTRPEFFETSPAANWKIGSIPVMSITGALGALFFAYGIFLLWNDPIAAGPLFTTQEITGVGWAIIVLLVAAAVWYLGTKWYRRRQGIEIEYAFRRIPIE